MLSVIALDLCRRCAAEGARLGQLLGRRIHHAAPRPIITVAITMVRAPLVAPLVPVTSSTTGLLPGRLGAACRAVLAAPSRAVLADDEIVMTPPALELRPDQHQFPVENWARRSKRGRVSPQLRLTPRPWKTRRPCDGTAGSSPFLSRRDRDGRCHPRASFGRLQLRPGSRRFRREWAPS